MGRLLGATEGSIQTWKWCMSLITSCSNFKQFKPIHAIFITNGLHQNAFAISKLISFCSLTNSPNLSYASLLFHHTQNPNSFIYNTLIRAYSRSSQSHLSLHYFRLMLNDDDPLVIPDYHTFPFVLIACSNLKVISEGKQIHCLILKNGLASTDSHLQTALLRFCVECCGLVDANKLFDEIPERDVIKWNVLMNGYVKSGFAYKALNVFSEMLLSGLEPDEFCIATGLTACAHSGALEQGIWIHEFIQKKDGINQDVFMGTALVDMYAKCGCIGEAVKVFDKMPKRNEYTWAAMISGFALHGFAEEAINSLDRMMREDRIKPDGVVLLGVLMACTHAGFEEKGRFLLENMEAKYGIVPKHEHYSCMVDLLCRANRLDEAIKVIKRMPMKPRASVWGALLSACRTNVNVELAELAFDELLKLEHEDGADEDSVYVQLSNIYFAARRSRDAQRVRKMMGDRNIKKKAGCSVVEVNGEVNEFVSGDMVHSHRVEIHSMLDFLSLQIQVKVI